MTAPSGGGRWLAAGAGALLIAVAAAAALALRGGNDEIGPRPAVERPKLLLLTSLPIMFPEQFTLDAEPSPALEALQSRYEVIPISTTDAKSLDGQRMLLMAQPNAQPAEMLVELDRWVREGGRALLLADPALEWESELPLTDPSRPPVAFPDSGLLQRWGLKLHGPSRAGTASVEAGGKEVVVPAPGTLSATGPYCTVAAAGFIARCRIGKGSVTVVADADFVQAEGAANLPFLLAELARLEQ